LTRRRKLTIALAALGLAVGIALLVPRLRFPPDTTPQGAYLRIAAAVGRGEPEECFAYLEEEAQHACFTIVAYSKKASELIGERYPEPERSRALAAYQRAADCADGAELWAMMAQERGWISRLRRDLSGVDRVEQAGERATVVTARATRYPFRRRPCGIWGLTMFTAELEEEAERLARDWALIEQAAQDYDRGD